MKVELINLGRMNVNKVVEVKNTKELHREIGKYIASKGWGMEQTEDDPNVYEVEAGFRTIGKVKILED